MSNSFKSLPPCSLFQATNLTPLTQPASSQLMGVGEGALLEAFQTLLVPVLSGSSRAHRTGVKYDLSLGYKQSHGMGSDNIFTVGEAVRSTCPLGDDKGGREGQPKILLVSNGQFGQI